MDDIEQLILQQMEEEEEEKDQEAVDHAVSAIALALVGVEHAHQLRVQQHQLSCLYLCHGQLLPNPCIGTPWQALYNSCSDCAFITTMGFDIEIFDYIIILEAGFMHAWNWSHISRSDSAGVSGACPGGRSLDAPGALGLVLHYLNSTM